MSFSLPRIIQGGMGAGVSNWRLARAVSRLGQLGVVSGTGLDQILVRRLQDGDPGGETRRALSQFPFPRMVQRLLETYFVPEGRRADEPYSYGGIHTVESRRQTQETCILANFVEVFLARLGHDNPVGINYLEKIQLPHLPSLYGALLAGVGVVIMGAGIPLEIPGVLDALVQHRPASYPVAVTGAPGGAVVRTRFDPADFIEPGAPPPELTRPLFWPIVSTDRLAAIIRRRANGPVDGFVVEGPRAGGHNAPPRRAGLDDRGQPVYGPADACDLEGMRRLGLPFFLAGAQGSPEALQAALAEGAAGVQVGTAFALCAESGLAPDLRRRIVRAALSGEASVFTDPLASPTGFPFKVARLPGSLSEAGVYAGRRRRCDLGFLREVYQRPDGRVGYRCPAEPASTFVAKGGRGEDTGERRCLCNALLANIGMAQRSAAGDEPPLVTLGDDLAGLGRFRPAEGTEFTAADVLRVLLA